MNTPALAPVLPTPSPSPAAPGASAPRDGEPSAFARELQSATAGSGSEGGEDTPDPARDAAADEARADGRSAEAGTAATPARQATAASGRGALDRWLTMARAGGADRGVDEADAEAGADGEPAKGLPRAVDDEATAPEAAALLAALMPRQPEDKAAAEAGKRADGGAQEEAGALLAGDARPAPGAAQLAALAARQSAARGDDPGSAGTRSVTLGLDDAEGRGNAAAGLGEDLSGSALAGGGATPAAAAPLPGFAAELARAGQVMAGPAGSAPGAAAEINLPTPVHGADFMPRLSGELAVLARDGVQEARVHVNPAELGPIAVQITLDGSAAQVRLAVEQAQTRDLLEQGMPTLAAALRENGLTLTGGGVFQQARDPGRDAQGGQDPSARGGAGDGRDGSRDGGREPLAAAAPARRVRHPGQVDLYA